jgi:hypothetical protein
MGKMPNTGIISAEEGVIVKKLKGKGSKQLNYQLASTSDVIYNFLEWI